jgi:hypothetical protein
MLDTDFIDQIREACPADIENQIDWEMLINGGKSKEEIEEYLQKTFKFIAKQKNQAQDA